MSCIFCKIIEKKAPAKVFYEDDNIIVFADIIPRASIHLLICPKEHYGRLIDLPEKYYSHILKSAGIIAEQLGVEDNFRLVLNNGDLAGQIVGHLHFHFLSDQPGAVANYKE